MPARVRRLKGAACLFLAAAMALTAPGGLAYAAAGRSLAQVRTRSWARALGPGGTAGSLGGSLPLAGGKATSEPGGISRLDRGVLAAPGASRANSAGGLEEPRGAQGPTASSRALWPRRQEISDVVEKLASLPAPEARGKAAVLWDRVVGFGLRFTDAETSATPEGTPSQPRAPGLSKPSRDVRPGEGGLVSQPPAPPGGGAKASGEAPRDADPPAKAGVLSRVWRAVSGVWRVLPDPEANREFWRYTWGQALISVGMNFGSSAHTGLVSPAKELSDRAGYSRGLNAGTQMAASLVVGQIVDRSRSIQRLLVWTYLGRALLLMTVPVLFMTPYWGFGFFLVVVFSTGILQSFGTTAGEVAYNRIIGEHTSYYNKANAVYSLVVSLVGIIAPLLAGAFIASMDSLIRPLAGNALSYGVYGLLTLAGGVGLYLGLRIPRDELLQARRDLAESLKGDARVKGVVAERLLEGQGEEKKEVPTLLIEVSGDPAGVRGLPAEFQKYPVRVIAKRSVFRDLADGFILIWRSRFLRIHLLITTFSVMMTEPPVYLALPRYISEVVALPAIPAFLEAIPWLGGLAKDMLSSRSAFLGFYISATSLGLGLASLVMMFIPRAPDSGPGAAVDRRGLTPLERQGRWSSIAHGLGWLLYWGVFFSAGLWGSLGAILLASILQGPAMAIWSSLTQKVMHDHYRESMGRVSAAMSFYRLFFSMAGAVLFGLLMRYLSTVTALWIAAGVLTVAALFDFLEPFLVFPIDRPQRGPKD